MRQPLPTSARGHYARMKKVFMFVMALTISCGAAFASDKPEVIIEIGEVQTFSEFNMDRKDFCAKLSKSFENFCINQQEQISSGDFKGYRYLFKEKLSWWRDIERRLKNIGMKDDNKQ